ncbi:MAG: acyl--CoA ligase [Burkholderiales bacterium]|nr:acyl--CoA ligase [Burkholderiales bacterium]
MVGGLTREQVGVTEAMQAAFGEAVFRMSHNLQVREGDPIRKLDWAEIERQREAMGLADGQIAERIGLTRAQVTWIRNAEETRRFTPGRQAALLELGGGKRYRKERFVPIEDRFRYSDDALALRAAMRFDPARVADYVARGLWNDDTLPKWLARHVRERGDALALVHGDRTLTWRALSDQVLRLAAGLRGAGVARGDVVAVQLPNTVEFVVTYLAIARLGAVMVTIHMPYRAAEIATLMAHSRAVAAVCIGRLKDFSPGEAYLAARANLPRLRAVVTVGESLPGALAYTDLVAGAPIEEDAPGPVASDPFLLLYTSGTTAAPKAVPHPYHTMLGNGRVGAPEHRIGPTDRVLSAAPFSHLFGLYSLHVAWSVGATCVLLPVFTPPDLAATVARDAPTGLWTAPAHIAACRALGLFDKHDFGSLKLAIMSGSACPPELVRWFQARTPGCAVTQLWGMTETQGALYTRPGDPLEIAATTAGRVSPGTEVRIVGADGRTCAPGETGELQVRGSLLFPGFFDNDAANQAAFTADGWYRTGDLAVIDAAGNVAITGREKDIINRGGVKFNPRDLEDLLDAHPQVMQSAIVPMPDPVLGERACCFITVRPGAATPTLDELVAFLSERNIARNKLPERLVVVEEMPLTPTRKIIKGRLRLPT